MGGKYLHEQDGVLQVSWYIDQILGGQMLGQDLQNRNMCGAMIEIGYECSLHGGHGWANF
jgi:hypothetical protein